MDLNELIKELREQGIYDKKAFSAIKKIDRKLFVLEELKDSAYENIALPIKEGQTISQPYTVAIMLQALELKKDLKVLEIGTGSGYNACLIAEIIKPGKVYTTEIIPELARLARENIKKTKLKNIEIIEGDGSAITKNILFDRIIITAACPEIPKPLIKKLKKNGIIIAPVGSRHSQELTKLKKIKNKIYIERLGGFVFVPLKGKYGY